MKSLNQKKKIYTTITFLDIAGLVKGASKGEGLGNKFLSHIREVDAIVHLLRCFDSDDIQNVNKDVNPIRDLEIIETEMKLADLESIGKRLDKKNLKKITDDELNILKTTEDYINNDKDLNDLRNLFDLDLISKSGLLSLKPKLYVCNVDEKSISSGNKYSEEVQKNKKIDNTILVSAEIENQINQLENNEKKNFMELMNIEKTGLNYLIEKGYKLLELETFFTSGPEESRAWTVKKDSTAPVAETISFDDFVNNNGWLNCKNNGKMRLEGKDYIVKDGDILNFRFNT